MRRQEREELNAELRELRLEVSILKSRVETMRRCMNDSLRLEVSKLAGLLVDAGIITTPAEESTVVVGGQCYQLSEDWSTDA